jgi:hypothetical protein
LPCDAISLNKLTKPRPQCEKVSRQPFEFVGVFGFRPEKPSFDGPAAQGGEVWGVKGRGQPGEAGPGVVELLLTASPGVSMLFS